MTRALTGLTRIHVEGFRSLKNVDLEPGRITVLIGPNGSGKSNLLSLLRMVSLMRTQSLRRFVGEAGGASTLLHYGAQATREVRLRLEFEQESGTSAYSARLGYAARDAFVFLEETVEFRRPGSSEFQVESLGAGHDESRLEEAAQDPRNAIARAVRWWLSRMSYFHFHDTSGTSPLRQNARQSDDRYLRSDGSNLAAFLWHLSTSEALESQKAWKRISHLVRRVAPFIKRLSPELVNPEQPQTSPVRLRWVDEKDHVFDTHDFSDGTLRAISLITALAQPSSSLPAFVSVDEPELGLHPTALTLLTELVRSVAPRCQALFATQSPALMDLFEPDEVVVTERTDGEGGDPRFRRLKPQELSEWLEDYTLSELYEKNVLGGLP